MVKVSQSVAIAQCNAAVDLIDTAGPGTLEFRTGSAPALCSDATTGTLLATLTFSATAFGAAADANPGAVATAAAITEDTAADADGDATYARAFDGNGACIMQFTVSGNTGGSGEIQVTSSDATATITAGLPVSITSFTFTQPEA